MKRITFYTRADCHLCDAARFVLEKVRGEIPFKLEVVDIDLPGQEDARRRYTRHVPVIHVDGVETWRHRVEEDELRGTLLDETV